MKQINRLLVVIILLLMQTACSDFLDTFPHDSLSPGRTWKTEDDAQKFLVGCYDGWNSGGNLLYLDCASDFGYSNFPWEGWKNIANGMLTASTINSGFYNFTTIRKCTDFLDKIDNVKFKEDRVKNDMIGQVRAIRAFKYFQLNYWFGGVPIIKVFQTAEEAKVARETEEVVKNYVYTEIDEAISLLNEKPSERGLFAKGAGLCIKMRSALYYGDFDRALDAAKEIISLGQYELDSDYSNLFTVKGQDSKEIIVAVQYLENVKKLSTIGQMYNNSDGGWSSIVPTKNLLDMYEMEDGTTISESEKYNPEHPFAHRDPRMAMTILFPGQNIGNRIINTLDESILDNENKKIKNKDYPLGEDNASKTALSWYKYVYPKDQYSDIWNTSASPIVFRYAEVLLTLAEAQNELSGPSDEIYEAIDKIRVRVKMPPVDRAKYSTKETLRELIRRERSVEFAGEGHRRNDILRWKDSNGKMLAETVLNGPLYRIVGTVDNAVTDPSMRAKIKIDATEQERLIENRAFSKHNRYLPIPQEFTEVNSKLVQNEGY